MRTQADGVPSRCSRRCGNRAEDALAYVCTRASDVLGISRSSTNPTPTKIFVSQSEICVRFVLTASRCNLLPSVARLRSGLGLSRVRSVVEYAGDAKQESHNEAGGKESEAPEQRYRRALGRRPCQHQPQKQRSRK